MLEWKQKARRAEQELGEAQIELQGERERHLETSKDYSALHEKKMKAERSTACGQLLLPHPHPHPCPSAVPLTLALAS